MILPGGRGAALLAAMRKNKKPGESPADVSQAPSEPASSALDTSVQSTSSTQGPVGRGALLAGALASRPGSSAASVASSQGPAVGRQALLERLKIKTASVGGAGDSSICTPKPPIGRAALVKSVFIIQSSLDLTRI